MEVREDEMPTVFVSAGSDGLFKDKGQRLLFVRTRNSGPPTAHVITMADSSKQVRALVMKLKRRQLSSKDMAIETAKVLERVIGATKGNNPRLLLTEVQDIGRRLEEAAGSGELIVGNICRRVLFIIRDEYSTLVQGGKAPQSEEKLVTSKHPSLGDVLEGDLALPGADRKWTDDVPQSFKSVVVESIKELIKEIESIKEHVADQAMEHVHANEVILTCGYSTTVLHFLMEVARRNRKFEVVVSEMAPSLEGHAMAQALAKAGISTTVITDAAIFALMARVNKVIVGCQAVLANGGITCLTGIHTVAVAAKHYNVPLVVCTGLYKLAPVFPHDQYSFNELRSPADISKLDPEGGIPRSVSVLNPTADYIPPELVSLFITNAGGHNPSYIYRLLAEYYSTEDRLLRGP